MGAKYSVAYDDSVHSQLVTNGDHAAILALWRLHAENNAVRAADMIRDDVRQKVEAHALIGTSQINRWKRGIEELCKIIQSDENLLESPVNVHHKRMVDGYEFVNRLDGQKGNVRGGTAAVYSVRLRDDGKTKAAAAQYAMKILYPYQEHDEPNITPEERHNGEWSIAGDNGKRLPGVSNVQRVHHYFIDRLPAALPDFTYDIVQAGTQAVFIVMDLQAEPSLHAVLVDRAKKNPLQLLTPMELLTLVLPLANTLATFNNSGILYPDLKPSNILLSPTGEHSFDLSRSTPYITGFGRAIDLDAVSINRLLPPNVLVVGSSTYLAPELGFIRVLDTDCSRSMVYSFGCLLLSCMIDSKTNDIKSVTTIDQLPVAYPEPLRRLAIECTHTSADKRPSHEDVILRLWKMYDDNVGVQYRGAAGTAQINDLINQSVARSPVSRQSVSSTTAVATAAADGKSPIISSFPSSPLSTVRPVGSISTISSDSVAEAPPRVGGVAVQLYIRSGGTTFQIDTTSFATVRHVKMLIHFQHRSWPVDEQRLIFAGRALEDHHTLNDCNISQLSALHLQRNGTPRTPQTPHTTAASRYGPPPPAALTASSAISGGQQSTSSRPAVPATAAAAAAAAAATPADLPSPHRSVLTLQLSSSSSSSSETKYATSTDALIAGIACLDIALADLLRDLVHRGQSFQEQLSNQFEEYEISVRKQKAALMDAHEIEALDHELKHEKKIREVANTSAFHNWLGHQAAAATRLVTTTINDITALRTRLMMESPGIWLQLITNWMTQQIQLKERLLHAECSLMTHQLCITASSRLSLDPAYSQLMMYTPHGYDDVPSQQSSTSEAPAKVAASVPVTPPAVVPLVTPPVVTPSIPIPAKTSTPSSSSSSSGVSSSPTDGPQTMSIKYSNNRSNRTILVVVTSVDTVRMVKQQVTEQLPDLPIDEQRLVYAGITWADDALVSTYSLATTSTIVLTRVPGIGRVSQQQQVPTSSTSTSTSPVLDINIKQSVFGHRIKIHPIRVHDDDRILIMKYQLQRITGIPYTEQSLIYAGRALDDNKMVGEYNVSHQSTIHLVLHSQQPSRHHVPAISSQGITVYPSRQVSSSAETKTAIDSKEMKRDPSTAVSPQVDDIITGANDTNERRWCLHGVRLNSSSYRTIINNLKHGAPHVLARNVATTGDIPIRFTLRRSHVRVGPINWAFVMETIAIHLKLMVRGHPLPFKFVSYEDCDTAFHDIALRVLCERASLSRVVDNAGELATLTNHPYVVHSIIIGDWSLPLVPANFDMKRSKMYSQSASTNIWSGSYKKGGDKTSQSKLAVRQQKLFCPLSWYRLSLKVTSVTSFKTHCAGWYTGYVGANHTTALAVLNTYRMSTPLSVATHIIASPSSEYAAHPSTCGIWRLADGRWVQILLQVRVRPAAISRIVSDSITSSTNTLIDSNFATPLKVENKEVIKSGPLEWTIPSSALPLTNDIVCFGIMIRLLPASVPPPSLLSSQWWKVGPFATLASSSTVRATQTPTPATAATPASSRASVTGTAAAAVAVAPRK